MKMIFLQTVAVNDQEDGGISFGEVFVNQDDVSHVKYKNMLGTPPIPVSEVIMRNGACLLVEGSLRDVVGWLTI